MKEEEEEEEERIYENTTKILCRCLRKCEEGGSPFQVPGRRTLTHLEALTELLISCDLHCDSGNNRSDLFWSVGTDHGDPMSEMSETLGNR